MILVYANETNTTDGQRDRAEAFLTEYQACGWRSRSSRVQLDETTGYATLTFDAHGTTVEIQVDVNASYRIWTRGSGWTAWSDGETTLDETHQRCRDCHGMFLYDPAADRCPSCAAEAAGDWIDDGEIVDSPRDYLADAAAAPRCTCQQVSRDVFDCPAHGETLRAKHEGSVA